MGSSSHLVVEILAFTVFVFGCSGDLAGLGFMGKSYSMEQAFRISSFQYRIPVRMTPNMAAIKFILPAIKYPFMLMTHLLSIYRRQASAVRLLIPAPAPVSLP